MKVQFHHLALFYSIAVVAACASQAPPSFGAAPSSSLGAAPSGSLGAITRAEIERCHGTTAYQVVERVRPLYLTSKLDLAPNMERQVYLNGVRLGGLTELRLIPATEVKEIRFVRAIDGGADGGGRSGGAILVISKVGH